MIDMQQQAYTGVDNLEVMQEAVNYNRYLLDTVRKHAPAHGKVLDFGAGGGQFAAPLVGMGWISPRSNPISCCSSACAPKAFAPSVPPMNCPTPRSTTSIR